MRPAEGGSFTFTRKSATQNARNLRGYPYTFHVFGRGVTLAGSHESKLAQRAGIDSYMIYVFRLFEHKSFVQTRLLNAKSFEHLRSLGYESRARSRTIIGDVIE